MPYAPTCKLAFVFSGTKYHRSLTARVAPRERHSFMPNAARPRTVPPRSEVLSSVYIKRFSLDLGIVRISFELLAVVIHPLHSPSVDMAALSDVLSQLLAWMPDLSTIMADLTFVPRADFDYESMTQPWQNMRLNYYSMRHVEIFNGYKWSRTTSQNWQIPLGAVAVYIVMIPLLRAAITQRVDIRRFAIAWNLALSAFSLCGLVACAPVFISELRTNGLYFTVCAPAPWCV